MRKKYAVLIYTSRGEVIAKEALIQALRDDRIGRASLHAFAEGPLKPKHPLLELENVIASSY